MEKPNRALPAVRDRVMMPVRPIRQMTTVFHWAIISCRLIKVPILATSRALIKPKKAAVIPEISTMLGGRIPLQKPASSRMVTPKAEGRTPFVALAITSPITITNSRAVKAP